MKKLLIIFLLLLVYKGFSQENYLGDGPFDQLIIRGVTLINGDGSPPRGPVDIVVENNTIEAIQVIRSATLNGAEALGWDDKIGSVQIGKLADFVIVEENPLQNLKVLYGTGAIKLTKSNEVVRVGGVKYTIKDGVIYDAKKLLFDVKKMVDTQKEEKNWILKQPGIKR